MLYEIGIENGNEGRSIAWVHGHPGCFAYGQDANAALEAAPEAIRAYIAWIGAHTKSNWLPSTGVETRLVDTWEVYHIDQSYDPVALGEGYNCDAWFRFDWKPLSEAEVEHGLLMLEWSRADLLQVVHGLSEATLDHRFPEEQWSIRGILAHVGGADWWYMDRLGMAFSRQRVPEEAFARLEEVREHMRGVVATLADIDKVVGVDGEFWSPRKLLRRALWHERDHTEHIRKLITDPNARK
jgi:hypothetical protein